jgi:hypothetical protein
MKKTTINRLLKLEASMGVNEKRYVVVVPRDVYHEMVLNGGQTDWEPEGGWPENPYMLLRETMTKEAWLEKYGGGRHVVTEEYKNGWLKMQGFTI